MVTTFTVFFLYFTRLSSKPTFYEKIGEKVQAVFHFGHLFLSRFKKPIMEYYGVVVNTFRKSIYPSYRGVTD